MDMATLNTRVGWAAATQSSLGWFRDNSKPIYRTYALQGMAGYYWYQSNLSGSTWNVVNCNGEIHVGMTNCGHGGDCSNCTYTTRSVALPNCAQDNGAPMGNCNCNCTNACGNCTASPQSNYPIWGGGQCAQCDISGQCDTRAWMQPNCNCIQCNCACNCYAYGQCTVLDCNCNCNCACECECAAGACFLPDMLVVMADGSLRRIADIGVGDALLGGTVIGLHRPLLGDRSLWTINGIETTGDHLFRTELGWTAVLPHLYDELRRGRTTEEGFALGYVDLVADVLVAEDLLLYSGLKEAINHDGITDRMMPPETQLYSLVTDSGLFVLKGGYVVDGMPQPGGKQ